MVKKQLIFILLISTLILNGCNFVVLSENNENENVILNPPTADEESQENIDTSGWEIYRNEEYGFEFKYPKEWEVFKQAESPPWVKVVLQNNLTVSNLPMGFENAELLDNVTINNQVYSRSLIDRTIYKQHVIILDNGYYIYYTFQDAKQLKIMENILFSFRINR